MTKKHFNALAAEFREEYDHINSCWAPVERLAGFRALNNAVAAFCRAARSFNPRFDAARFCEAAGVREELIKGN